MHRAVLPAASVLVALAAVIGAASCSGGDPSTPAPAPAPAPVEPAAKAAPPGPLPALVLTQARFEKIGGKTTPKPATLWLWRTDGTTWWDELVEDRESNVFHKGLWWRDGILTIGAMKARLVHWKRDGGGWVPTELWSKSWGGKFDRLRDVEIGDVDGDGKEDLVIATHDMGVVAVGTEQADGTWSFVETPVVPDTFVHEIEIGDVDGDGKPEWYGTPSDRNRSSGASQPGAVARYDLRDGAIVVSPVVRWEESHAKEILVTDLDGDGVDELYAVREAHVQVDPATKAKTRVDPVKIVRLLPGGGAWTEQVVATLDDDQCRFLLAADANHDGRMDLVAAGKESGLWMLERVDADPMKATSIARDSGGFEHATHAADLDGDGKVELYVASDTQGELRRYVWKDGTFEKTVIAAIPPSTITWNIQDGRF